jgi:hypothetical protein
MERSPDDRLVGHAETKMPTGCVCAGVFGKHMELAVADGKPDEVIFG